MDTNNIFDDFDSIFDNNDNDSTNDDFFSSGNDENTATDNKKDDKAVAEENSTSQPEDDKNQEQAEKEAVSDKAKDVKESEAEKTEEKKQEENAEEEKSAEKVDTKEKDDIENIVDKTDKKEVKSKEDDTKASKEVEIVDEKPKKRRTRRSKKDTAKTESTEAVVDTSKTILNDNEPINMEFVNHLLFTPGEEFDKQMEQATEMMNSITITADMSDAVIRTMEAKNSELSHFAETRNWAWHTAFENLTNRDTGLIKRVKDDAMLHTEGSVKDKEIAATVAASNYEYNGNTVNLLQYANALRGASYFFSRVLEFTKTTGIALATCRKTLQ